MDIIKLLRKTLVPKKRRIFIKEFDVTKIEPYIQQNLEDFTVEDAYKIMLDINKAQYEKHEMFVDNFYISLNKLIEGAYITGLTEAKNLSEEEIELQAKTFKDKL